VTPVVTIYLTIVAEFRLRPRYGGEILARRCFAETRFDATLASPSFD
jgi:hypothetical protein